MENLKILVKFPTRGRPDKFFNVLDTYREKAKKPENIWFIVSCDSDDQAMLSCKGQLEKIPNLICFFNDNSSKIQAINADISTFLFDILLLAADDMIPKEAGYDSIIREKMSCYFPDLDGVLWFNDGYKYQKLNTLPIMGKRYYDRFKYIYYPQYQTMFADAEFTEVAILLGKIIYFDQVIIEHQHPDYGFCDIDHVYRKNMRDRLSDKQLYEKRKKQRFGILLP